MNRKLPIVPLVVAGIVVLALAAALATALTGDGDDGAEGTQQIRPVAIDGAPLAPFDPAASPDPAVGTAAPRLEGTSFDGSPVTIAGDGRPKLVVFVAHWCPHCQAEVPVINQWLENRGQPEGVDLYGVSTGASQDLPNWPPSEWLADEGWKIPTLADDADSTAGSAYGVSSYPFFVTIDADGNVVSRGSGELTPDHLDALIANLS